MEIEKQRCLRDDAVEIWVDITRQRWRGRDDGVARAVEMLEAVT